MIIDNSEFPERKVVFVDFTDRTSMAYKFGKRFTLKLECGHTVGCKNDTSPKTAKCLLCHLDENGPKL